MAFVPVPNTAQVEMRHEQDGQQMENVFHFESGAPFDVAGLTALANACATIWDTTVSEGQSNDVTLTGVVARSLESAGAPSVEITASVVGGITSGALPTGSTIAVKWLTGLSGRSFRGRTYHIGLAAAFVSNSQIEPAYATQLLDEYNGFQVGVEEAVDVQMVVVSRVSGGVPRVTGVTTPITGAAFADHFVDSQRRRLPGRGI